MTGRVGLRRAIAAFHPGEAPAELQALARDVGTQLAR